jgi:hypothetical protein
MMSVDSSSTPRPSRGNGAGDDAGEGKTGAGDAFDGAPDDLTAKTPETARLAGAGASATGRWTSASETVAIGADPRSGEGKDDTEYDDTEYAGPGPEDPVSA